MKTNVVLNSVDRNLFGINIQQNTKDHSLSITDLQKAYELARFQFGWKDRRINDILQYTPTQERIYYLLVERELIKTSLPAFMEMVSNEGIVKVLKGLGVYKTTGARQNKHTYADPYIWILLAMELNPMIYARVIVWLTDSLVFDRIEAGSEYLPMNNAIKDVIDKPNYPAYSILINKKVFGKHISGIRNLASAKELKKISDIEKQVIIAIEMKWIKNERDLITFLSR